MQRASGYASDGISRASLGIGWGGAAQAPACLEQPVAARTCASCTALKRLAPPTFFFTCGSSGRGVSGSSGVAKASKPRASAHREACPPWLLLQKGDGAMWRTNKLLNSRAAGLTGLALAAAPRWRPSTAVCEASGSGGRPGEAGEGPGACTSTAQREQASCTVRKPRRSRRALGGQAARCVQPLWSQQLQR